MFPLYTKTFPSTAAELQELLNASIQRVFTGAADAVTISGANLPDLAAVRIGLDKAELRSNPEPPPRAEGASAPALVIGEFTINGKEVTLGPARADLKLSARDVRLNRATDATGEIVLVLKSAAEGEVEVSVSKDALERAIASVATSEAGKHGVSIDQVRLTISTRSERGVDAEVQLRGRKLFFSTVIRITAKLDLDEQLNARVSGMRCNGEGAIGALACNVLAPHLQAVDGRTFPLMALPLGEVRLRDVRLAAGERITVTAEFGS
ncbi:MAG: LmeA family phospholipid-binding protein [Chthoniobacterales bacterium]